MVQPVKKVDSLIPDVRENLEGDSPSLFTVVELGVELTRGSISPGTNEDKDIFLAKLDFTHEHSLLQKQHN